MQRIEELEKILQQYEISYRDGNPEVSDFEFDLLVNELKDLYLGDIPSNSILSKIVPPTPVEKFEKTQHKMPMLSLSNTYNKEELTEWYNKTKSDYTTVYVQEKVDGCSLSCIYEHGKLIRIVTRGDGITGEDITPNKFIIDGIPDTIDIAGDVEIRGEVYMEYDEFNRINSELIANNEEPYANPRNLTAGTIKLLDRNEIKNRHLKFVVHSLGYMEQPYYFLSEFYSDCKRWGFNIVSSSRESINTIDDILAHIDIIEKERPNLAYPIDGAVVKYDDISYQNKLGNTSKSPRWGIAYKYEAEKAEAKVLDITLQVGRTGQITPVAELSPTQLAGSTVKRATCHNIDEMISRDIRIGDTVLIEKSGDVIPYLIKSLPEKRDSNSQPYVFDEKCPVCGAKATKYGDKKAWYCVNSQCPAILQQSFEYFVSKNCMNIDGVSGKLIEKLIANGKINEFKDLFTLTYNDIISLEKMGETSANKVLKAISDSKKCDLWRFIAAISLPGIGKTNAKAIADDCDTVEEFLRRLKSPECAMWFKGIGSIGDIISGDIALFAMREDNIAIIENLISVLEIKENIRPTIGQLLGKTVCITGTFDQPRESLIQIIEANGGKFASSVSKKTSFLLAGRDCGSKLKKAQQNTVTIVYSIQELLSLA